MLKYNPGMLEVWGKKRILSHLNSSSSIYSDKSMLYITRLSCILAFLIGFILTIILVLIEINFLPVFSEFTAKPFGVVIFLLSTVILVMLEFYLLFAVGFYCVACYIREADLAGSSSELKFSLVRAVLEIPEPNIKRFGLDPYKFRHKSHYLMLIIYKLKTFSSSFLAKWILRNIFGRTSFRAYSSLIAAPITGLWDSWVMGVTMREARIRISGRLCSQAVLDFVNQAEYLSCDFRIFFIRLVSLRLVMFNDYNINLDYLIQNLCEIDDSIFSNIELLDCEESLIAQFERLQCEDKELALNFAALLLGYKRKKFSRHEKRLMLRLNLPHSKVEEMIRILDQSSSFTVPNFLIINQAIDNSLQPEATPN